MHIESIRLKNFKCFRNLKMTDLPRFCVIVGANGTGKSTIFRMFEFLQDALATDLPTALTKLGGSKGFKDVRTREQTGKIEIELAFREKAQAPLMTYSLAIGERKDRPFVARETLQCQRGTQSCPLLDFRNGKGTAAVNQAECFADGLALQQEEQKLRSPDVLALKGLAQFQRFPAALALGQFIESWRFSNISISRARQEQGTGDAEHLSREGENLALVVKRLSQHHPQALKTIREKLAHYVPGLSQLDTQQTQAGRIQLRFKDEAFAEPFLADQVSDGTIAYLAYLALLKDPKPHPLLCVEEPESRLYLTLLWGLAEDFRYYAERGCSQVFVATQAPEFLTEVELDEVFWLVKLAGCTKAHRARETELVANLMANGDKMGRLWREGSFLGAHPW